ncbi:MAG: hypothetical protein IPL61_19760 [Myxococcales bacterium]|nr:hypothetical protein [Myxococcales bacterium]
MALALTSRRGAIAAAASAVMAMALAATMLGRGCGVTRPGPEAAVRGMIQAARAGDRKAVWRLLSPQTQRALEDRARKATDLVGASTRYTALDLISVGTSDDVPPPTDVREVSRSGDRAVVEVGGPTGRAQIEVVRVDGRWRIDLPAYRAP